MPDVTQAIGKKEREVWVLSELYYPEETSTGYFLTRIAEGLARHFTVGAICGQPSYAAKGLRAPAREMRNGVEICRCRGTTFDKDSTVLRLANAFTVSGAVFLAALRRVRRGDCVLVVTNPPVLPFLAMAACRMRGAKCLVLIHDVYPEVLFACGMVTPEGIVARVLSWLSRRLCLRAEVNIVLGRDMKQLLARKTGDEGRITIIPNWADLTEVSPLPREGNAFLERLGLPGKFVVQYAGNMGRTHGLDSLLGAAERLQNCLEVHFLFIGSGARKDWLEQAARDRGLRNVTVLPRQPREELSAVLSACDVAVISFLPGMAGVSVPSRMYNILAAGKPILGVTDRDSELALVIEEERVGWVVPPSQPEKIVEAIQDARSAPDVLAEMGQRARTVAEKKYSPESVIQAYVSLIDGCD